MKIEGVTFERTIEMAKATWHVMAALVAGGAWVIVTYMNLTTQVKANTDAIAQTRSDSQAAIERIRRQDKEDLDQIIEYLQDDRTAQKWMMRQFPAFKKGDAPDLPATPRTREERNGVTPQSRLYPRIVITENSNPELSDGLGDRYDYTRDRHGNVVPERAPK